MLNQLVLIFSAVSRTFNCFGKDEFSVVSSNSLDAWVAASSQADGHVMSTRLPLRSHVDPVADAAPRFPIEKMGIVNFPPSTLEGLLVNAAKLVDAFILASEVISARFNAGGREGVDSFFARVVRGVRLRPQT